MQSVLLNLEIGDVAVKCANACACAYEHDNVSAIWINT